MPQKAATGSEAREVGPEIDGDADDAGARSTQAVQSATVNSTGQVIGQLINAKA